jgi:uncharacterized protein YjeT (DUF2065 family)
MGAWCVGTDVIRDQKRRTIGTAMVLVQGLVTALFPQLSVKFIKNMIGKNFDNAADLQAKPAYLRQLRAIGVGTVAAAGTSLLLQSAGETEDDEGDEDEDDDVEAAGEDE